MSSKTKLLFDTHAFLAFFSRENGSETIKNFFDAYAFLSNFYNAPVSYNDLTYHNSEAAFQAQKEIICEEEIEEPNKKTI